MAVKTAKAPVREIDSVLLSVVWSRLTAAVDEANTTMMRTSFSPVLRDSNDCACVLTDVRGGALAQSTVSIPSLLAVVPNAIKEVLRRHPAETWQPGDVVITNDPWIGSGHLYDTLLVSPVFHGGELVAFYGSIAHKYDIGGQVWSADAPSLFEEGLFLPVTHLYRSGEPVAPVFDIIRENVRGPEGFFGDLNAQLSGADVAAARVADLLDENPGLDLLATSEQLSARSEKAMREAIATLTPGTYRNAITTDGIDEPLTIAVSVTVTGDSVHLDFTGTSPQVGKGVNSPITHTRAYAFYALKCALDPATASNDGSYRPFAIEAPAGSIVNATRPAAVNARHQTGQYLPSLILGALAEAAPDRVIAESGSPAIRAMLMGQNADGTEFSSILFVNGGMGARPDADGLNGTPYPTNATFGSVEVLESLSPIVFAEHALVPDSGGRGRFRGGLGKRVTFRYLGDRVATLSVLGDRFRNPPKGVLGGGDGSSTEMLIDGEPVEDPSGRRAVAPGSTITFTSPGGGGFGDPGQRDPAAIEADLRAGYITREEATGL